MTGDKVPAHSSVHLTPVILQYRQGGQEIKELLIPR